MSTLRIYLLFWRICMQITRLELPEKVYNLTLPGSFGYDYLGAHDSWPIMQEITINNNYNWSDCALLISDRWWVIRYKRLILMSIWLFRSLSETFYVSFLSHQEPLSYDYYYHFTEYAFQLFSWGKHLYSWHNKITHTSTIMSASGKDSVTRTEEKHRWAHVKCVRNYLR